MLFCFTIISGRILRLILGNSFCAKHHILAHFSLNAFSIKSSENYLQIKLLALLPKMLAKTDPWHQYHQHGFFTWKTNKLHVFENEFCHAILYKNCASCANRGSHLAVLVVLVAIHKSLYTKELQKVAHKNVDEIDPWSTLPFVSRSWSLPLKWSSVRQ